MIWCEGLGGVCGESGVFYGEYRVGLNVAAWSVGRWGGDYIIVTYFFYVFFWQNRFSLVGLCRCLGVLSSKSGVVGV